MLANGYMGYRGTLDGDDKHDFVALSLAGLYDGVAGKWRETVNAPDPLFLRAYCDGEPLLASEADEFSQSLDMRRALLTVRTCFKKCGVNIKSERIVHFERMRELGSRVVIHADEAVKLRVEAGINGDVWDLNGPHLKDMRFSFNENGIRCECKTQELGVPLSTSLCFSLKPTSVESGEMSAKFFYDVELEAGEEFILDRIAYVGFGEHSSPSEDTAFADISAGYDAFFKSHIESWERLWDVHDVRLVGDRRAQLALRYSIYHLLILTPRTEGQSIAARGLSGQTYKGAVFLGHGDIPVAVFCRERSGRRSQTHRI